MKRSKQKRRRPTLLTERKFTVTITLEMHTPKSVSHDDVFELWDVMAQDTDTLQEIVDEWAADYEDMRNCVVAPGVDVSVSEDR